MNKHRITDILNKYQGVKSYTTNYHLLLSGYKSFKKPFLYQYRLDIIDIINARAYRVRINTLMKGIIKKAIENPHLLNRI